MASVGMCEHLQTRHCDHACQQMAWDHMPAARTPCWPHPQHNLLCRSRQLCIPAWLSHHVCYHLPKEHVNSLTQCQHGRTLEVMRTNQKIQKGQGFDEKRPFQCDESGTANTGNSKPFDDRHGWKPHDGDFYSVIPQSFRDAFNSIGLCTKSVPNLYQICHSASDCELLQVHTPTVQGA